MHIISRICGYKRVLADPWSPGQVHCLYHPVFHFFVLVNRLSGTCFNKCCSTKFWMESVKWKCCFGCRYHVYCLWSLLHITHFYTMHSKSFTFTVRITLMFTWSLCSNSCLSLPWNCMSEEVCSALNCSIIYKITLLFTQIIARPHYHLIFFFDSRL